MFTNVTQSQTRWRDKIEREIIFRYPRQRMSMWSSAKLICPLSQAHTHKHNRIGTCRTIFVVAKVANPLFVCHVIGDAAVSRIFQLHNLYVAHLRYTHMRQTTLASSSILFWVFLCIIYKYVSFSVATQLAHVYMYTLHLYMYAHKHMICFEILLQ